MTVAAKDLIANALDGHRRVSDALFSLGETIEKAAVMLIDCYRSKGKVLVMGNGGSAADAQHFAAELVGRYKRERRALPAIALTTDTSILTSVANDYSFEDVFARQVEAHAVPGDVVIGISTSGGSENVARALARAREIGARTIAMTGGDGGRIGAMVDLPITVPVRETPRIQEGHITVIHILCDIVEAELAGDVRS